MMQRVRLINARLRWFAQPTGRKCPRCPNNKVSSLGRLGGLFDRVMFRIKILDQFTHQIQQTSQWMIVLIANDIQQGIHQDHGTIIFMFIPDGTQMCFPLSVDSA